MKLVLILLCFLVTNVFAQEQKPFTVFMGEGCFFGLLDANQKELLSAEYASLESIPVGNDWLVTAKRLNHFSYFLHKESKLIPLKYPQVSKLNSRLLKVGHAGECGVIDTDGKGVLLMNYDNIYSAGPSAAITVYKKAYGVISVDGKTIIKNKYRQLKHWEMGGFWAMESDQYQLLSSSGEVVAGAKYDDVGEPSLELPICAVSRGSKWGVINAKNEVIVDINCTKVKLLDIGLIASLENEQWQLKDINGQRVTDDNYDVVEGVEKKAVLVGKGNKFGLLTKEGRVLLPVEYSNISYIGNDWVTTSKEDGVVSIYSIKENKFLKPSFQTVKTGNNLETTKGVLIQKDKGWAWFDYKNQTIKTIYINAYFYPKTNIVIVEGDDNKIGCLDSDGKIILPTEYTVIIPKGEYFKVKKESSNWLYVNKENEIINCQIY